MNVKIYVSHRMTGRYCDELVVEAALTKRVLENFGFEVLDPILEENIKPVHEILNAPSTLLEHHWRRDKEMMKEADILLDYQTDNKSDGAITEVGYTRFCLWKPVVRVLPIGGFGVSRIEQDNVVPTLVEAAAFILSRFGTYEKLHDWRKAMWDRCFSNWLDEQMKMHKRYGITSNIKEAV